MAFWAKNFIYNDKPSELYNLTVSSSGGEVVTDASSDVTLYTESIYRKPKPYLLGVTQDKVLTFPVEFNTPYELTAQDYELISRWLFGQTGYKKFMVEQYDMQDIYFNCYFTEPKIKRVGNIIRGVSATAVCDAPWGWTEETFDNYSIYTTPTIYFNNQSDNNFYLYPKLKIYFATSTPDGITITNVTDGNRQFIISPFTLPAPYNEIFTFDNDLQIISSTANIPILPYFNKNWFRLVPGINQITFSSPDLNVVYVEIYYSFAKKIGG